MSSDGEEREEETEGDGLDVELCVLKVFSEGVEAGGGMVGGERGVAGRPHLAGLELVEEVGGGFLGRVE